MKLFLSMVLLITSFYTFACPDLSGKYQVDYETWNIVQNDCEKIIRYSEFPDGTIASKEFLILDEAQPSSPDEVRYPLPGAKYRKMLFWYKGRLKIKIWGRLDRDYLLDIKEIFLDDNQDLVIRNFQYNAGFWVETLVETYPRI